MYKLMWQIFGVKIPEAKPHYFVSLVIG